MGNSKPRIFICYRNNNKGVAEDICNWITNNKKLEVYCSKKIPYANYVNDICIINDIEWVILLLDTKFAGGFSELKSMKENPERGDVITAYEIREIMKRAGTLPEQKIIPVYLEDAKATKEAIKAGIDNIANISENADKSNVIMTATEENSLVITDAIDEEEKQKMIHHRYSKFFSGIGEDKGSYSGKINERMKDYKFPEKLEKQAFRINEETVGDDFSEYILNIPENERKPYYILVGEGGMGKTTQLRNLTIRANETGNVVAVYVEAYEMINGSFFGEALRSMGAEETENPKETLLNEFSKITDTHRLLFVVDGIDEIDTSLKRSDLLKSMHDIRQKSGKAEFVISTRSLELVTSSNAFNAGIKDGYVHIRICDFDDEFIQQKFTNLEMGSRLFKMLHNPFYYSIYSQTPEQKKESSGRYYNYDVPSNAGEMMWNYVIRNIEKPKKDQELADGYQNKNIYFLMIILPEIAYKMALYKRKYKEDIDFSEMKKCFNDIKSSIHWYPFYSEKSVNVKGDEGFDEFENFFIDTFPLLTKDANSHYKFCHSFMLDFFHALHIINQFSQVLNGNTEAEDCIYNTTILNDNEVRLVGEICGETRNNPCYKDEGWKSSATTHTGFLSRALNKFRNKPGTSVAVFNIFNIIKTARADSGRTPDMSDLNFDGLDLTKCSLNNIIFSHEGMKSSFRSAKFDNEFSFATGYSSVMGNRIEAIYAVDNNHLISIDSFGHLIVWDIQYGVPTAEKHLCKDDNKHCISNMASDIDGNIYVVCDGTVFRIGYDAEKRTISIGNRDLKNRYIKYIFINNRKQLQYQTFERPFNIYGVDGKLINKNSSELFVDVRITSDGRYAYCLVENSTSAYTNSISGIVRYKNKDGVWIFEKIIKTGEEIFRLINVPDFTELYGGIMFIDETPGNKKLILSASVNCKNRFRSGRCIIEIDIEDTKNNLKVFPSFEAKSLSCVVGNAQATEIKSINAMCTGLENIVYYACGLDIYMMNANLEIRRICSGGGSLFGCAMMHNTQSFVAVTTNPGRLHFFDCTHKENSYCKRQIAIDNIDSIYAMTMAFEFKESQNYAAGTLGLAEHPDAHRMVFKEKGKTGYKILNLYDESVSSEIGDAVSLIRCPVWALTKQEKDEFLVSKNINKIQRFNKENLEIPFEQFELNSQWLFAGCDFSDAEFVNGQPPEQLWRYIRTDISERECFEFKANSGYGQDDAEGLSDGVSLDEMQWKSEAKRS